jgi:hypothetical protein
MPFLKWDWQPPGASVGPARGAKDPRGCVAKAPRVCLEAGDPRVCLEAEGPRACLVAEDPRVCVVMNPRVCLAASVGGYEQVKHVTLQLDVHEYVS